MAKSSARGRRGGAADPLDAVLGGTIAPIYYICGESFPRLRLVSAIRRAVLGDEANVSVFNYDGLAAKSAGAHGILDAARTMPMFGDKRLVQVADAHELPSDELNALLPYVKDPSPHTVLLLVGEKADMRMKFFGTLKKSAGVVHRYESLKERQAPAWVSAEARRQGVALEAGAAELIADAVGVDMGQLASALERLSLFAGEGERVSRRQVEDLLAQTRHRSIFELTNAVGRGDRREAMLVLRQMQQAREPALRIVAMLSRHLRQLWTAQEMSTGGAGQQAIAERLGIHPFFIKDLLAQAWRFKKGQLERTHRALFVADRTLKSSRLSDAIVMDRLVLDLCR